MARPSASDLLARHPNRPRVDANSIPLAPDVRELRYQVLSDEEVKLTDAKAAAYIDLPVFRGERNVTDADVQRLYDCMKNGTFNAMLVILATCEFDGVVYKINGQHTCWAKYYCTGYEPKVREIRYKVQTEEQLRQLYATFDRNKPRSNQHITMIELANNEALKEIPITIVKFLAPGFRFWLYERETDRDRCTPEMLGSLIANKHLQLFILVSHFYYEYVKQTREMMFIRRRPVAAAMFETFNKVSTLAPDFWRPVIDGVGLENREDPRLQLRTLLQNVVINSISRRGRRSVDDETMYNYCIPAFNKWRKGEPVRSLRASAERIRAV